MNTKPKKKSLSDANSAITGFMQTSNQNADDRFTVAKQITAELPTGLTAAPQTLAPLPATLPDKATVTTLQKSVEQRVIAGAENDEDSVLVDISLVDDNPYNARWFYEEKVVQERAASIAAVGQLQAAPACINPHAPGRFMLIGGHYRKRALLYLGKTKIRLHLNDVSSPLDLFRLSYAENGQKKEGTPLDNAFVWKNLLDQGIASSIEHIAQITGENRATVSKHIQLLQMPQTLLDVLMQNPSKFTLTSAYEIQTMVDDVPMEHLLKIAEQVVSAEGLSTRELAAMKKRLVDKKPRKNKEHSRQYKITIDGVQTGQIKDWDTGKVELTVEIHDQAEREKLVLELRQRFGLDATPAA